MRLALAVALAVGLSAVVSSQALTEPPSNVATDRALFERAVDDLEAARAEAARIDAELAQSRAELDRILSEQQRARDRLSSRANMMYRCGDVSLVGLLLGADSLADFTTRWQLLIRMSEQDAADLVLLESAAADAEHSAQHLMQVQAECARALDEATDLVTSARRQLAASETALREYEAKVAEETEPTPGNAPGEPASQVSGSGPWEVGVASHYSLDFSGRGASGTEIGPYSMIVAHRTLPFGTLVEFEFRGKRAMASVEDRGPHSPDRMWDLGPGVARVLGFVGVDEVRYRVIDG